MPTISHGLAEPRDVRAAPPLTSPLCCFSRRGGWGVEPIYSELRREIDRSM